MERSLDQIVTALHRISDLRDGEKLLEDDKAIVSVQFASFMQGLTRSILTGGSRTSTYEVLDEISSRACVLLEELFESIQRDNEFKSLLINLKNMNIFVKP